MTDYSGPQPTSPPLSPADDKLWASLSHFLNIILLVPALVIHLVFKDRGQRTRIESKEALNWTINVTGVVLALNIISWVFAFIPILGLIVSGLVSVVIFVVLVLNIVFAIIGGIKVNGGGSYRYPLNIRWIK